MFNYRNTNWTFILAMILIIILGLLLDTLWFLIIGASFLFLSWATIMILGSIKIQWNYFFFSYSHGDREIPVIALTFDDGPHRDFTPRILEILDKHKIKAAFFCVGKRIEEYPEIFKKINNNGHLAGNHSYSHSPWFDIFPVQKMTEEILRTDKVIENLTGLKPKLFRAPFGVTNPALRKALRRTGHISVSWSLRSFDTVLKPEKALNKVIRNLNNGDIVLFHDRIPGTPQIIDKFISHCLESGLKFVRLDELLNINSDEIID